MFYFLKRGVVTVEAGLAPARFYAPATLGIIVEAEDISARFPFFNVGVRCGTISKIVALQRPPILNNIVISGIINTRRGDYAFVGIDEVT